MCFVILLLLFRLDNLELNDKIKEVNKILGLFCCFCGFILFYIINIDLICLNCRGVYFNCKGFVFFMGCYVDFFRFN